LQKPVRLLLVFWIRVKRILVKVHI
jgi:hypothetical protein